VKDARAEAQKEIEEYKKKKEEEFKKFEAEVSNLWPSTFPSTKLTAGQHASGNKKAEEEANKDAEIKLKEITEAGKKTGSKVVEDLITAVITVNPEVPDKIQREEWASCTGRSEGSCVYDGIMYPRRTDLTRSTYCVDDLDCVYRRPAMTR
jgi:V-type H+-transporting ATPase subunit G